MTKYDLEKEIERKYQFYENMAMTGAHHLVLERLEQQLEDMATKLKSMD